MRYFCFIILLLGALPSFAQQDVKGSVTDERNMPLPGATISLKKAAATKMLAYAIADSLGKFVFKNIKAGDYHLEANFMTYKSLNKGINVGNTTVALQHFRLLPELQQLNEVTIQGKKQAISVTSGKTTMNVEQSSLAQSQSAYDLLKSLPGVNINKDGDIRIKGKSGVTVMIDGEPAEMSNAQLKSILKGTPGTTLQSIEVMNNPPSSMDAAGTGGVINIVFKKKVKKGFNGSLSSNLGKGRYYKTNQSLNMNYGKEKWDLKMTYAYDYDHNQKRDSLFRINSIDGNPLYMSQLQLNPERAKTHLFKMGIDHHFDEKNTLGTQLSFNDIRTPVNGNTTTRFGSGSRPDSVLNQKNMLNSTLRNWEAGLKYKHKFNEHQTFSTSVQFNTLKSNGTEDYTISKTIAGIPVPADGLRYRNFYPSKINRGIFKADFEADLLKAGEKIGRFETGLKSSFTDINNNQRTENRAGSAWISNGPGNQFRYREAIQAAYGSLELNLEPWTIRAGLRAEYTRVKGDSANRTALVKQNYFSLFPNVLIGYKVNDAYNLSMSYNRRIERPEYENLNPAARYLDLYTTEMGNPKLKPQFSHNIELNQQFLGFIDLNVGYSQLTNPIYYSFITTPGLKSYYTSINAGRQHQWETSLGFPIPGIDWWENYQSVYFFTSQFNATLQGKQVREKANSFGFLSYNSFKLPASFNLELTGWYQGAGLSSNFRYKPLAEVNIGLNKKLLNDRLTLGVAVADAFYSGILKASVVGNDAPTFNLNSRTDSRQLKFSLNWNFGKKRAGVDKPQKEVTEDNRMPSGKLAPDLRPVKP
uniref:outer membrane beta-barrel protein n=1 Tax=Pedobacter schmidteae TaxID=2201271 RepID=UPI0013CF2631|nr:outer membrane beta-barrel protein [Pedobacter schmidteae]